MLPLLLPWIFAITLGLVFGSFLNVCIARLPQHRSIAWPGSQCPRCGAAIRGGDNVPVVSWLLLGGLCRQCRQPIAIRYPLVELSYASLVAACLARFGFTVEGMSAACFCLLALGLLVMDLETMLLPDSFTLPGIVLGLLSVTVRAYSRGGTLMSVGKAAGEAALAALVWAMLLLGIRWGYYAVRRRHGLGLGDVKLVAMLAAWLGASGTALCFLLAVVGAALAGLALVFLRRAQSPTRKREDPDWRMLQIPLGSFLCAAGLYALFFEDQTLKWYFSFWP